MTAKWQCPQGHEIIGQLMRQTRLAASDPETGNPGPITITHDVVPVYLEGETQWECAEGHQFSRRFIVKSSETTQDSIAFFDGESGVHCRVTHDASGYHISSPVWDPTLTPGQALELAFWIEAKELEAASA